MSRIIRVGFSQRILLDWLDRTMELSLTGRTKEEIIAALQDLLCNRLSVGGTAERGNREKAITILMKIWVTVPQGLKSFRDDGIELLKELPVENRLPVHLGMTIAVYPFFGVVSEVVGRLLKLQGVAVASHVQRRVRERLGERETVSRAARRILRCLMDWGVLRDTSKKGVYEAAPPSPVNDQKLAAWLVEATMLAGAYKLRSLDSILDSPLLFPFKFSENIRNNLLLGNRLEVSQQALNDKVITWRVEPPLNEIGRR